MNRVQLQRITEIRVREARSLMRAGHSCGAYYLIGYAVECALKACVAKQINEHDFPDKKMVQDAYTHSLEKLVGVAGLRHDFQEARRQNPVLRENWAITKDWSEAKRYEVGITDAEARDLFSACTSWVHGVLAWIRTRW